MLVPPDVVATFPSEPSESPVIEAGPKPLPNTVTISPGATPPAWNVAPLTTPAVLKLMEDEGGSFGTTDTFMVADFVESAKETAVTVTGVLVETEAGGV